MDKMGYSHDTATSDSILEWVGFRLSTPTSRGRRATGRTIQHNLSAIKSAFLDRRWTFPECNRTTMPIVWAAIDGAKAEDEDGAKLGIDQTALREMFRFLDERKYDDLIWRFILSMCLNTLRRIDEVLRPDIKKRSEQSGGIRMNMLEWQSGGHFPKDQEEQYVSLIFNKSKGNKKGRIQTALMWCHCGNKRDPYPCALHELLKMCSARPRPFKSSSRILRQISTGEVPTYKDALSKIKMLAQKVGFDPKHIGTHSLRRGGLQDAEKRGDDERLIDQQGGCTSKGGKRPYQASKVQKITNSKLAMLKSMKWTEWLERGWCS